MTGDLILNGAPTADNQAATKAYVDSKSGGEMLLLEAPITGYASRYWYSANITIPASITDYNFIRLELAISATGHHGSLPYMGIAPST